MLEKYLSWKIRKIELFSSYNSVEKSKDIHTIKLFLCCRAVNRECSYLLLGNYRFYFTVPLFQTTFSIFNIVHVEFFFNHRLNLFYICRATILAVTAYLEAFQKIADSATNTRGKPIYELMNIISLFFHSNKYSSF